jgi:uridine kinase
LAGELGPGDLGPGELPPGELPPGDLGPGELLPGELPSGGTGWSEARSARVVILAGPSGVGKSRLAGRLSAAHGWPVVRLDDFYRDEDDPLVPRSESLGIVDWDHPDSWDPDAAVAALAELVRGGSAVVPVYDIAKSRAVGSATVVCEPQDLVLAEGIFAAEIVDDLRRRGLLRAAYCVHRPRVVTFVWRLLRDLSERRKPPMVLLRRGLAQLHDEPAVVSRAVSLGAVTARPGQVERDLSAALTNSR